MPELTERLHLPLLAAYAVALGAALVFVYALFAGREQWLLVTAALLVFAIPLMVSGLAGHRDLFAPINFVAFGTLIGVAMRTVWLVGVTEHGPEMHLLLGNPPEILLPGLAVLLLAMTALGAGYLTRPLPLRLQRWRLLRAVDWDSRRLTVVAAVLSGIALLSALLFIRETGISDLVGRFSAKRWYTVEGAVVERGAHGYLRWGASLIAIVFYVMLAWFLRRRRPLASPAGVLVTALGIAATLFPIIVSSRTGTVLVLVYALFIYHYCRRPINLRWLVIFTALGLGIITSLGAMRSIDTQDRSQWRRAITQSQVIRELTVSRNFIDVTRTALIIDAVPDKLDYQYGKTMIGWLIGPVPRQVWKDKPVTRAGPMIEDKVYGDRAARAGVPPGFVAELWLNFGLIAVPVGMYLLGFALRTLYENFRPLFYDNPNAVLVYSTVTFPLAFILPSNDLSGAVVSVATVLLPLLLVLWLIGRPRRVRT